MFDPGNQNQNIFWAKSEKLFFTNLILNWQKIIGVCEVHLFYNRFFTTSKYSKIQKFVQNWSKINFREKVHLKYLTYFCRFYFKDGYYNFLSETKNDRVMAKNNLFDHNF